MAESIEPTDPRDLPGRCAICGRAVEIAESFIVRIDVYADPTLPEITAEDIAKLDLNAAIAEAADAAAGMSADDLQDGVHRRFNFRICPRCQPGMLANPLGLPRKTRANEN
jgi:hypothetical protein